MKGSRPVTRIEIGASVLAYAAAMAVVSLPGCVQSECAVGNYDRAECRVVAENERARLSTLDGTEVRFQSGDAVDSSSWDATGLLREESPGMVRARVAGPGRFALSVDHGDAGAPFELVLENVDPGASVAMETASGAQPIDPSGGLERRVQVPHPHAGPIWIRGTRPCPPRYRLAAVADIQTNPDQLERIAERLREEALTADLAGEPLVGVVVLGDVTESSEAHEFERVGEIVRRMPVPVAVTPGNHDVFRRDRAIFNVSFGPGNHAFEVCDARVVLADTGNSTLAPSVEGRLATVLDRGGAQHLLFGTHYPLHAGFTGGGWGDESQLGHVLAELAIADADLLLAGHVHALRDYRGISVGETELRQIIVGTGGANQGLGVARYGYLRLVFDSEGIAPCFVEVPPPGTDGPVNEPLSSALPYCDDA